MKDINIKEIAQISDLIIGNNKDLDNEFTNKEIINFFVKIWFDRNSILVFSKNSKNPKSWLTTFLKDLYDNGELTETLNNLSEIISFYNPNFKKLLQSYYWTKDENILWDNNLLIRILNKFKNNFNKLIKRK